MMINVSFMDQNICWPCIVRPFQYTRLPKLFSTSSFVPIYKLEKGIAIGLDDSLRWPILRMSVPRSVGSLLGFKYSILTLILSFKFWPFEKSILKIQPEKSSSNLLMVLVF